MSPTTKIIVALSAVIAIVILLRWLLHRSKPRLHHYLFGHGLLPNVVLSKSDEVLCTLLSPTGHSREGDSFLVNLWLEASRELPSSKHIPAAGLTYAMDVLHSPRSAAHIVKLPTPERPLEAYFAAIVFDSIAFAAQQPAGVRYFTLERSVGGVTMIGESRFSESGEIEHVEHGECPGIDKEAFLTSLRTIITDTTKLDESHDEPADAR